MSPAIVAALISGAITALGLVFNLVAGRANRKATVETV